MRPFDLWYRKSPSAKKCHDTLQGSQSVILPLISRLFHIRKLSSKTLTELHLDLYIMCQKSDVTYAYLK